MKNPQDRKAFQSRQLEKLNVEKYELINCHKTILTFEPIFDLCVHETEIDGRKKAQLQDAHRAAQTRGCQRPGRHPSGRGWGGPGCQSRHGIQLVGPFPQRGIWSSGCPHTRWAQTKTGWFCHSNGCTEPYRKKPAAAEVSLCAVDGEHGGATDFRAFRGEDEQVLGVPFAVAVGADPATVGVARLREAVRGGSTMAAAAIPAGPAHGQKTQRPDLLWR